MLIDSHCHLDFACFDPDREAVILACEQLGIDKLVVPGTQASGWHNIFVLAAKFKAIKPAIGLHPYFLAHYQSSHLTLLIQMLNQFASQVTAVGEIGLDYVIEVDKTLQMQVFTRQLAIANDLQLPVILHHRRSHNDLIKTLKQQRFKWGGIVHAFSGSLQEAGSYLELGFKLGVGGIITYERARKTREVCRQLPLDALVLETDSPDMPPFGKQGLRNNPQNLMLVLAALSHLRQQNPEEIMLQCRHNILTTLKNMDTQTT